METLDPRQQPVKTSRFCRPLNWATGSLNDSTYKAFCRFAGHVLDQHSTAARGVLREVACLIEAAGDSVKKDKLIEQFSGAFAFIAEQRAAKSLGALEFIKARSKWPDPEPKLIESTRQAYSDCTLGWWEKISPARVSEPSEVLPIVFSPGSLVCYGLARDVHRIDELGERLFKSACVAQYVVPNPAKAHFIALPGGKRSLKYKENFPRRRFQIVEFDRKKIDPESKLSSLELLGAQASLHAHLEAEHAPLALLVYSGNESIHGWYPTLGADESKALAFLRYACRLGADAMLSSKCQFTRMPGGQHANGTSQVIHYFNPKSL
jgi:hypothetical protein